MRPPYRYLGANIDKVQTGNGSVMWVMCIADYCKAAITNLDKTINVYGKPLSQYGNSRRP